MSRDGRSLQVRRDAHGVPLWLALPGGQVYWLSLSNSGTLRKVSAQGHDIAHITYHGNTGLLATKSDENSWTTVYEWVCGLFIKLICLLRSSFCLSPLFLSSPSFLPVLALLLDSECLSLHCIAWMCIHMTRFTLGVWNMSAIWWSLLHQQSWRRPGVGLGGVTVFFLSSF